VERKYRTCTQRFNRAFRRCRSLLLLNLEKQVQLEELPWVAAVEPLRTSSLKEEERSRRAMEEVAALTLTSFPHAIIPNKLLQEVNALAKGAKLELPLVEGVAADIFMGRFSGNFLRPRSRPAGCSRTLSTPTIIELTTEGA
jgi:hypothetical protein